LVGILAAVPVPILLLKMEKLMRNVVGLPLTTNQHQARGGSFLFSQSVSSQSVYYTPIAI